MAEHLQVERLTAHAKIVVHQRDDRRDRGRQDHGHDRRQGRQGDRDSRHRQPRERRRRLKHPCGEHVEQQEGHDAQPEHLPTKAARQLPRSPERVERAAQLLEHDHGRGHAVAAGHEDGEPEGRAREHEDQQHADAAPLEHGPGDPHNHTGPDHDESQHDRLPQPDGDEGQDLREPEREGVMQPGVAAEVGVRDDPDRAGGQHQRGGVVDDHHRDEVQQRPQRVRQVAECPQVAERPQADVHEEHDRHGEGDQGELQKQPEMTAVDHEGAVEDLPEVHGTDVGHLPLAPIAGWR